ncbi:hypothetical protein [Spiribacter pallidus]|jgi:ArsR family transcriptional regulator|uniref:HTH arsR-type domain-containing protein n=1 Tax=Spiribacter pallidus TaxID=1987936 RepID=A0ABV3T9K2_9GAMM
MGAEAENLEMALRGADFHRLVSDDSRLKVLMSLRDGGELEAEELAIALMQDVPDTRRRLSELAEAGLLAERRERFRVHYRLADGLPAWVSIALGAAADPVVDRR